MAFDFDEECGENIVNLIEKPQEEYVKSPRYRSIHSRRARLELARSKSAHKTLGLARTPAPEPHDYLRKRSGLKQIRQKSAPPATSTTTTNKVRRHVLCRLQLPKWTPAPRPRPATGLPELPSDPIATCNTNFPRRNLEIVKNLKPKPIVPRFVDTRRGDAHDLMASGLQPIFIYKENFGKVPNKLKQRFIKIREKTTDKKTDNIKSLCRYVTEDEREQLLEKLKMKWQETMKQFQCLPFIIDSVAKRKRKITLESKLKQLEEDIDLIERHPYIYVYDDDKLNY